MNRLRFERHLLPAEKKVYVSRTVYDAAGNTVSQTDANEHTTTYAYDVLNRRIRQTNPPDADGKVYYWEWTYEYDADLTDYAIVAPGSNPSDGRYRYVYERDPRGNVSVQILNQRDQLRFSYDQLGNVYEHQYDGAGREVLVINPQGYATKRVFDGRDRWVQQIVETTLTAGGSAALSASTSTALVTKRVYDDANRVTAEIVVNDPSPSNNQRHEYVYDALDRVRLEIDAEGNTTRYTYDLVGNLVELVQAADSPFERTTTYAYDIRNRRTSVSEGGGAAVTTYTYDKAGNVLKVEGPGINPTSLKPYATEYRYDEMNRFYWMKDAEGNITFVQLDGVGNITASFNACARGNESRTDCQTRYEYDALNRRVKMIDAEGNETVYVYDPNGNQIAVVGPRKDSDNKPYRTDYQYDKANRLVYVSDAEGNVTITKYDKVSNVVAVIDARAHLTSPDQDSTVFKTTYTYDGANRLIEQRDALGRVTRFDYDRAGNKLREYDPDDYARRTEYAYDKLNRVRTIRRAPDWTDLDGRAAVEEFQYDPYGNVVLQIDPLGHKTRYKYNNLGFLSETVRAEGTADEIVEKRQTDPAGNVTATISPRVDTHGTYLYRTEYVFDGLRRVVKTIRAAGMIEESVTAYEYDELGNIIAEISPRLDGKGQPYKTTYHYDTLNRLEWKIDAEGNKTEYYYDAGRNVIRQVTRDREGKNERELKFEYDGLDRLVTEYDGEGRATFTEYDEVGNVRFVRGPEINPSGQRYYIEYQYDALNRLTRTVDPEGNITLTLYDHTGNVRSIVGPRAHGVDGNLLYATVYEYDPLNRVTRSVQAPTYSDAKGHEAEELSWYDAAGNLRRRKDALGRTTLFEYDNLNRLVRQTDAADTPEERVTHFRYDEAGNLVEEIHPRTDDSGFPLRTTYEYDALNRLVAQTLAAGTPQASTEWYAYDKAGNRVSVIDPRGHRDGADYKTSFEYDGLNRLVAVTDAVGRTTRYSYDPYGNTVSETDPWGNVTLRFYDKADRLVRIIEAVGDADYERTTRIDYIFVLHIGSAMKVTDDFGHSTWSFYDGNDRVWREEDALGHGVRYDFDESGNQIAITVEATGVVTRSVFDPLNRLVERTRAYGTAEAVTEGFEYDALGNLVAEWDGRGRYYQTEYSYDNLNRLKSVRRAAGTPDNPNTVETTYEYDPADNKVREISSRNDAFGKPVENRFSYDYLNRLIRATAAYGTPVEESELFAYDKAGNLVEDQKPDITTRRSYDAANRVTAAWIVTNTVPDGRIETRFEYHDQVHARSETSTTNLHASPAGKVVTTYYDALNRPWKITDPEQGDTIRLYDRVGNLIYLRTGSDQIWYDEYDAANRLASFHDGLGNQTRYEYNDDNTLKSVTDANGNKTSYTYDNLGRRITTIDRRSGVTRTTYDAVGNVLSLTDPVGNTTTYTYDGLSRKLTEMNAQGQVRQFAYDAAGNLILVTDRNGRQIRYEYDELNRRVAERWFVAGALDPVQTITMTYYPGGRLQQLTDGYTTLQYEYWDTGALKRESIFVSGWPRVDLSYATNDTLNVTSLDASIELAGGGVRTLLSNRYIYTTDTFRLDRITQSGSDTASKSVLFSYLPDAYQITGIARYAGIEGTPPLVARSSFTYNAINRIGSVTHKNASDDTMASYVFGYDPLQRVKNIDSYRDGQAVLTYDAEGQLTGVDYTNSVLPDETYRYDLAGNRLESHRHGTGYETPDHSDNQLATNGATEFEYDAEGNVIVARNNASGAVREFT